MQVSWVHLLLSQTKFSLSKDQIFPHMLICIRDVYRQGVSSFYKKNCSSSGGKESSIGRSRKERKRSVKLLLSAGNAGNEVKQTFFIGYADVLYWQQEKKCSERSRDVVG